MTNTNEEVGTYKQGRARKVDESNFYLMTKYLDRQSIEGKRLYFNKLTDEIREFVFFAPDFMTSKEYIDKAIAVKNIDIDSLEARIRVKHFPKNEDEKTSKEKIDEIKLRIIELNESYIKLTNKMMFDLHSIVMKLDEHIYNSLRTWMKQERYRKKKITFQVTLSDDGKFSLRSLKDKLKAKDYNDTLIQLNNIIKN
jgi:hypothetical protein